MPRFQIGGWGVVLVVAAAWAGGAGFAGDGEAGDGEAERPYGIAERVPLTTSRVVGRPDPPLPYRAVRAMPGLAIDFPICLIAEPGTPHLLLSSQAKSFGTSTIGRVVTGETPRLETLLDLEDVVYSLCVHPRFAENGYLYLGSNGPREGEEKRSRITRYTVGRTPPHAIDPASATTIIDWKSNGHDGAAIAFGLDGLLYVTTGDGTSDSDGDVVGQRLDVLLAKVLRIDVDHPDPGQGYSVPDDNPFVGVENARPETWAYGVRAPWRAHVDPRTGQLWVTQNGQDLWEQVYAVTRGANYGWSVYEGSHPFYLERTLGPTPHSPPTFEHPHSEARSLTGGVTYYGRRHPDLVGAYLYGDYSTGKIWAGKLDDAGQVAWHGEIADTTLAITSFAIDADGELLITDHQGTGKGGFYSLEPNTADAAAADFPRTLSASGLFASVPEHSMAAGVIPYSVNSPLWSDGAHKERFLAIPESAAETAGQPPKIGFHPQDAWTFPNGTVLVKSFALEREQGNPATRRWIETRFLLREQNEWVGYSYAWNDEQTDAALVPAAGEDRTYATQGADGEVRAQVWRFPSRTECMVCHSRAAGYVLGLSTPQMNRDHAYPEATDNQLRTLAHLGLLPGMDKPPADYVRLADPYDSAGPLESRARSYLHANCAHCHVEAGGGNAQMNLKFTTALDKTRTIGERPVHHTFDLPDGQLIAPGEPERSILLHRMTLRTRGQMPQIATTVRDEAAVRMMEEWIRGMGK